MASLAFLIPISLLLLGLAAWAFVWAVRAGQFDDLDGAPLDILRSDDAEERPLEASAGDPPATAPANDAPPADPADDASRGP